MPIAVNPETNEAVYLTPDGAWEPAKTAVNPQTQEKMAYDGNAWVPLKQPGQPKKEEKGVLGYVDDAVRSIASGVTGGFADDIGAPINAKINEFLGFGEYDKLLQAEQGRDEAIHPAIKIPGEIAGGVATAVGAAPLVAANAARLGLTNLPRAAQFGAIGAAEGGLAGAGHADKPNESRLVEGVKGAGIGSLFGAAAPYAAQGAANVVNRARGAFNPQAGAAADLGRAAARDGMTPAQLAAQTAEQQRIRPGVATVADAGGENVKGLVERVAQTPGAGRTQVVPALTGRQQQQGSRIARDLQTMTGTHRGAYQATTQTMGQRATAASPLYTRAYQEGEGSIISPELERLVSAPAVVKAMREAVTKGKNRAVAEGMGDFNPRVKLTESGVEFVKGADGRKVHPNLQLWDYTKRELDGAAGRAARAGDNDEAAYLRGLARQLRTELDEHVPTYAAARDAYAGPSAYMNAIEDGRNIMAKNVSAEEMAGAYREMGEAGQEAFRIGAVSAIIAKMGNDAARLGDMTKYLRSPEMRQKIAMMMPTEELRTQWAQRLDFEVASSEMTGRALGNSATARRLAERQDAENIVGDLVMDALTSGASASFLRRMAMAGPRWLRDTLRSRTDRELADVLTNPQRAAGLPAIVNRAEQGARPVSDRIVGGATVGGVAGVEGYRQ